MPDRAPQWKTSSSSESQLTDLRMAVDQLFAKVYDIQTTLAKINETLNIDLTQSRMLALIKNINGHGSAMPDCKGENDDHDERYVTKSEFRKHLTA
jgi:hypothetical protein